MFEISFIDALYKSVTYKDMFITAFPFLLKRRVRKARKQQQKTLEELKKKEKITVAFFLQTPSVWKYDRLYALLEKSERFTPVVVITPYNVHLNYDKKECLRVMKQAEQFASQMNYRYVSSFDAGKQSWVAIKKTLAPDIVFFTKPYKDTLPAYHIYNFSDKITCYTSYGFVCLNLYRMNYNLPFHNLLYHFFVETGYQQKFAQDYSLLGGENVTVSGSLGTEQLIDKNYSPKDVWKPQPVKKKRIIWAPHHTIDYLFNFSTFLTYSETMLELAKKYENEIQFAFKPHPVLKFKLINLWGEQQTNEYYKRWETLPNTQIEEGYYTDLFLTSDAMIHDSASFTIEYLHVLKPVLFTVKNEAVTQQWNPFGIKAFNLHYHAYDSNGIENFIQDTVLKGNDLLKSERQKFFTGYLYPEDGVMPSEKILQTLQHDITAE